MFRLRAIAAGLGVAAAVLVPAATASAATAPANAHPAVSDTCALGYVCMDYTDGTLENSYYQYGTYNFTDELGYRNFVNNQTDDAVFYLCTGYNGSGTCYGPYYPGEYDDIYVTPINSIIIAAS